MKNYKVRLSLIGILAVVLVMLPNMAYLFYTPPNDLLSGNAANILLWDMLENIGRFGLMIALCIIVNQTAPFKSRILIACAVASLFVYYALWIAYFLGVFNGLSLVGMAFFPSVFFLLIAWRQRNIFAFAFSVLFAITHIVTTSSNFLF